MTNNTPTFGSLFETSRDAIITIESDNISYMNPTARALFGNRAGLPAGELLPENVLSAIDGGSTLCADIMGKDYTISSAKDGGCLYLSLTPISVSADEQKVNLCANIATQLNEAITSVYPSICDILNVSTINNIDFATPGSSILHSYFRLKRLSRNITTIENAAMSEKIMLSLAPVNMSGLISDLIDTVAHFFPDTIRFRQLGKPNKKIYADVDDVRICEVVLNLIVNSLQHAKGGSAHIDVTLGEEKDNIVLTVADNCGGMSDSALRTAFTKYSENIDLSALTYGAGFGLAVCKAIIAAHDGTIVIESRESTGTVVRMTFPVRTSGAIRSQKFFVENNDMQFILTELSVVLDNEFFDLKYLD